MRCHVMGFCMRSYVFVWDVCVFVGGCAHGVWVRRFYLCHPLWTAVASIVLRRAHPFPPQWRVAVFKDTTTTVPPACDAPANSTASTSPAVPGYTNSGAWAREPASVVQLTPAVGPGARLVLFVRSVDAAGNVGPTQEVEWFVDVVAPVGPPVFVSTPSPFLSSTVGLFEVRLLNDSSPGQSYFMSVVGTCIPWGGGRCCQTMPARWCTWVLPASCASVSHRLIRLARCALH